MRDRYSSRLRSPALKVPLFLIVIAGAAAAAAIALALTVWGLPQRSPSSAMLDPGSLRALRFSPDLGVIATASLNGRIRLWSASDKRMLDELGEGGEAPQLVFSRDGRIFAWSSGPEAFFYDLDLRKPAGTAVKAHSSIYSIAIAPDNETVATGGSAVELWNRSLGDSANHRLADFVGKTPRMRSLFQAMARC